MHCLGRTLFIFRRSLHDGPSQNLRRKVGDIEKIRKKRSAYKDCMYVEVPPSIEWLDTASMPMLMSAVGIALVVKLIMMYEASKFQERIEQKIKNAPPEQGMIRMLTWDEWDEIVEIRPRTPFESKYARPNARIRTGEPVRKEDFKDWTIDAMTDAFTRAEETVKHGSSK